MHNIPQPDKRCSMFGIKGSFKKQALLFHIHKIQAVSGTKGLDFHRTFVFLERNSLSRVSFGRPTLLKGHYLWPLHAGISLKKHKRTTVDDSQEVNAKKSPHTSTAAPPLCFTSYYCFPTCRWASYKKQLLFKVRFSKRICLKNFRVRFRACFQWFWCNLTFYSFYSYSNEQCRQKLILAVLLTKGVQWCSRFSVFKCSATAVMKSAWITVSVWGCNSSHSVQCHGVCHIIVKLKSSSQCVLSL